MVLEEKRGKKFTAANEEEIRGLGKECKFMTRTRKKKNYSLHYFFSLQLDATRTQFLKKIV